MRWQEEDTMYVVVARYLAVEGAADEIARLLVEMEPHANA